MASLLAFWLLVFGALVTAWQAGDRHDHKVIFAAAFAAVLSTLAFQLVSGPLSFALVGIVDLILLIIVVRYSLRSARYWPIWFASFHAIGLILNLLRTIASDSYSYVFGLLAGICGIAALIAMVAGLLADQKSGLIQPQD